MTTTSRWLAWTVFTCGWALLAGVADAQGPLDFLKSDTGSKYRLDPVAPGDLLGVVVDAEDRGVAGATVYLRPPGAWRKPPQKVATDDRGQFVFPDLEPGDYIIAAVSGARATRTERRKWLAVTHSLKLDAEPLVLTLKPACRVEVVVTAAADNDDDAGEPRPLAGVRVRLPSWELPEYWTTDDEGRVVVEGLAEGGYEVSAAAPGRAKQTERVSVKVGRDRRIKLHLPPGVAITGVVRDERGEPVPQAHVTIRDPDNSSYYLGSAKCDAQGQYRYEHAPADKPLIFDFSRDGYLDARVRQAAVAAGELARVDGVIARRPYGGAVAGRVTGADGEPIAGAEVGNWGRSSSDKKVTYTNADGEFLLDDLHRGSRGPQVFVKAAGHTSTTRAVTPGTRDEPAHVDVQLKRGNTIRGRVVDERGEPLAGARVSFGEVYFGVGEETRTGPDGRFAFDTLPDDARFSISARGYSSRDRFEIKLNQDEPVEVVLPPIGLLRGRVVDAKTGEPVAAFHARATFSPDRKPGDPSGGLNNETYHGQQFNGPDGRFEFQELGVGMPLMVIVKAEGYRPGSVRRVEAARTDSDAETEIRLEPVDPESLITVAGRIVDKSGQPVKGVEVRVVASKDGKDNYGRRIPWLIIRQPQQSSGGVLLNVRAATDAEGRFRFEGLLSDTHLELAYWSPGVAATRINGLQDLPQEEREAMQLTAVAAASLTVTAAAETFPRFDSMQLSSEGGQWWSDPNHLRAWRPEAPNKWVIRDIPPGAYRFTVQRSVPVGSSGAFNSEPVHRQRLSFEPGEQKILRLEKPQLPPVQRVQKTSQVLGKALGNALQGLMKAAEGATDSKSADSAKGSEPTPSESSRDD